MSNSASNRRRVSGRKLVISLSLVMFFFGALLSQQGGRQVLAASPEKARNARKNTGCKQQMSADYANRVLLAIKAAYISSPPPPVRLARAIFQNTPGNLRKCLGSCSADWLLCDNTNTFISGSGCCAVCCWRDNPTNCSTETCCDPPLPD